MLVENTCFLHQWYTTHMEEYIFMKYNSLQTSSSVWLDVVRFWTETLETNTWPLSQESTSGIGMYVSHLIDVVLFCFNNFICDTDY